MELQHGLCIALQEAGLHQGLRVLHSMGGGGGASDTGKTCVEIDQQYLHEEGQASHLRTEAGAKLAAGLDFPR